MKATHCTECNVKLRSKHHRADIYPGTRERFGNKCKTCHTKAKPPVEHEGPFEVLDCTGCGRPTRDRRDTEHPDLIVRNGFRCFRCCKAKPERTLGEQDHRAALDSWLGARRRRLGVSV